ncbi:hypothetical protein [Phenylobacterium sp.]|uniref:hypothetical protein n=1 Tax=Phenylobacterium sp. TaxID=1871053 RepID=UPI0012039C76|nr:hypothetical protein [Phenylobacterium sp.]TAL36175.1 MAG: hypothetical protein EPN98_05450 [Phenylobacterium sp.]
MPGTNFENDSDGYDPQDQAEVFDETNSTDSGDTGEVRSFAEADGMRVFEDLPDVEDLTRADGDADDDEPLTLDADEFDPEAMELDDFEEDDELAYGAATGERQDDLDGQGPEDDFDEARLAKRDIDGLDEVRDASEVQGGEDDVTDFQRPDVSDADLQAMGYSDVKGRAT